MRLLNPTERKRAEREIEERRLYLEGLLTATPDAVVTLDSRHRIVEWNPGAERLFGYSREEVIGQNIDDLITNPDTYEEAVEFTQMVMSGKDLHSVETVRYRKGGCPVDVIVAGSPILEGDELIGLVAVYTDITERVRAEEKRPKVEATLRSLNTAALAVQRALEPEDVFKAVASELKKLGFLATIFLLDKDERNLRIAHISFSPERIKAAEKLLGLGVHVRFPLDRIPQHIKEVLENRVTIFGQGSERIEGFLPAHLRGLVGKVVELLGLQKGIVAPLVVEGEVIGALAVDSPELTENDVPAITAFANQVSIAIENARLYGQVRTELTERKRAEEKIRELSQFLDSVIDNANVWLDVLNEKANVVIWNRAAEEISGYSREEVVGHGKIWEWLYPDEEYREEVFAQALAIIEKGGEERDAETTIRRKDGQTRIISWNSRNLVDEKGNPIGSIALGRDITERKRAEEEIRRRSEELAALYDVSLDIAAQLDLDTLLKTILLRAMELLGANAGGLYLYHPERQDLELIVHQGLRKDYKGIRLALGQGACGKVAQRGKPLVVTDYSNWEGRSPHFADEPTFNVLAVPIKRGDTLLGALYVDDPDMERRFEEGDIRLATLFANQAAIAIENARLFEGERRKAAQLTVINEVSKRAISILDLDEMIEEIAHSICTGFDYYNLSLFLVDKERHEAVIEAVAGGFEHYVPGEYRQSLDEGIIGLVIRTGRSWLANDVSQDPYYIKGFLEEVLTKSELCVPIKLGGEVIGALDIQSIDLDAFDETDVTAMETLSGQIAIAIENARLYGETKRLAATDPLTGVWNRRHIGERLRTEVARARRFHHALSVLVMDIDNLKLFNDTYGHVTGDNVIRTVAQAVLNSCREIDIVGRYGGDEFAVILPEADARGAAIVAGRILATLEKEPFQASNGTKVPISISIGAASYPSDSDEADRLFSLADAAMYRAKVAGGGQFASLIVGPEEVSEELVAPFDVLQGLLISVDTKDRYTFKHSQEVTERALALARAVGLSQEEMRALEIAGKLHDVGKIGIPTSVLRKPGPLTSEEWKMIRQHPRLGHMILQQLPQMETVLEAVLHHHEWYDGTGYPGGLKGEEIPLLACILHVADAFSAMTTDRPYRKALTVEEALDELRRNAGKQFDAELAQKFIEVVEKGEIE